MHTHDCQWDCMYLRAEASLCYDRGCHVGGDACSHSVPLWRMYNFTLASRMFLQRMTTRIASLGHVWSIQNACSTSSRPSKWTSLITCSISLACQAGAVFLDARLIRLQMIGHVQCVSIALLFYKLQGWMQKKNLYKGHTTACPPSARLKALTEKDLLKSHSWRGLAGWGLRHHSKTLSCQLQPIACERAKSPGEHFAPVA